jgi:transposase
MIKSKEMLSRAAEDAKGARDVCERRWVGERIPPSLSDEQWALLEPLIPQPSTEGRPAEIARREIVTAILYVLRSGCPWRHLPHDLPAWSTVYSSCRRWRLEGVWDRVLAALRMQMRTKQGRNAEPSAAISDSQSIKTSAVRGPEKGYDTGKKNLGAQTSRPG